MQADVEDPDTQDIQSPSKTFGTPADVGDACLGTSAACPPSLGKPPGIFLPMMAEQSLDVHTSSGRPIDESKTQARNRRKRQSDKKQKLLGKASAVAFTPGETKTGA